MLQQEGLEGSETWEEDQSGVQSIGVKPEREPEPDSGVDGKVRSKARSKGRIKARIESRIEVGIEARIEVRAETRSEPLIEALYPLPEKAARPEKKDQQHQEVNHCG